ncbi:MAG: hypothetical protein AB7I30_08220 [Isosphaeraceae bacterium]
MTRTLWTRFVLSLAILASPALLVGCSEEAAPPVTDAPVVAPGAPGEGAPVAPSGEAAPGAPGEAAPAPAPEAPK